jgi:hypothetical protein
MSLESDILADFQQLLAFAEIRRSDPVAADQFWANIQNRRVTRAENNLRQTSTGWNDLRVDRLDPDLHQWGQLGAAKPKQIVTSEKTRATYIARIQKRVGFAKGTWINDHRPVGFPNAARLLPPATNCGLRIADCGL